MDAVLPYEHKGGSWEKGYNEEVFYSCSDAISF